MKGNEIFLFAVSSNCDGVAKGEVAVSGFNDRVHFVSSMKAKEYSEECVLFLWAPNNERKQELIRRVPFTTIEENDFQKFLVTVFIWTAW